MGKQTLIADIFRGGERLGVIRFSGTVPTLEHVKDQTLSDFVERSLTSGIDRFRDIHEDKTFRTVREPITKDDPGFPLAFLEWLRRHGFDVRERHPEVDEEINLLLRRLPDETLKSKVAAELPSMNYLEKTLILESLRRRFSGGEMRSN